MRRLVLGTLCVLALLTKTDPQSAHEFSRLGTVESIVDRGTYRLDDSTFIGTVDKIYRDGHFYSHQPPLLSTLEAPIYWVLRLPGTRFNNRGRFVMTYAFSLLTNGVALALTIVVFARLLALGGVAPPLRAWLAVLLPCGTWLLPYGVVTNNHGISGLLLALLAYLLLLMEWKGVTTMRAGGTGVVLGLLSAIEVLPLVSFAPLTLIYLARAGLQARAWTAAAAGLALPLLIHAAINVPITGDVIPAGFHHELFDFPGSVFDRASLTGGFKHDSWQAAAAYAWDTLFAGKGFFTFSPVLLLGLAAGCVAWRWWARARGAHLVLLGGALLSLSAAILTTNQQGGEAVGFRHAAYLAPALLVMLLPWLAEESNTTRVRPYAVTAIAALSAAVILMFAVRNPWKELTLCNAPVGGWEEYLPVIAKATRGELFNP